LKLLLVKIEIV